MIRARVTSFYIHLWVTKTVIRKKRISLLSTHVPLPPLSLRE
eukprot:UN09875